MRYRATTLSEIIVVMILSSILMSAIYNGLFFISIQEGNANCVYTDIPVESICVLDTIMVYHQKCAIDKLIIEENKYD